MAGFGEADGEGAEGAGFGGVIFADVEGGAAEVGGEGDGVEDFGEGVHAAGGEVEGGAGVGAGEAVHLVRCLLDGCRRGRPCRG